MTRLSAISSTPARQDKITVLIVSLLTAVACNLGCNPLCPDGYGYGCATDADCAAPDFCKEECGICLASEGEGEAG